MHRRPLRDNSGHSQKGWGTGGEIEPGKVCQGISGSPGNPDAGSPRAPDPLPVHETTHATPGVPVTCRAAATRARLASPFLPKLGPRRVRDGACDNAGTGVGEGGPAAVEAAPVSDRHAPFRSSIHKPASRSKSLAAALYFRFPLTGPEDFRPPSLGRGSPERHSEGGAILHPRAPRLSAFSRRFRVGAWVRVCAASGVGRAGPTA